MEKKCDNCRHSSGNNNPGLNCWHDVGHCHEYNKFEPVMEICCWNCKHYTPIGESLTCPNGTDNCLGIPQGWHSSRQGKYLRYYNHFVPKEDKMAWNHIDNYSHKAYEPKVEYKPTGKSLTARQVIGNSEAQRSEAIRLLRWMETTNIGMDSNLFEYGGFLHYALSDRCFRDFLLSGGYIEKVEEVWVSPNVGSRFKVGTNRAEYILSHAEYNKIVLISLMDGNRWASLVEVKDKYKITKEEFQLICGRTPIDELERI